MALDARHTVTRPLYAWEFTRPTLACSQDHGQSDSEKQPAAELKFKHTSYLSTADHKLHKKFGYHIGTVRHTAS